MQRYLPLAVEMAVQGVCVCFGRGQVVETWEAPGIDCPPTTMIITTTITTSTTTVTTSHQPLSPIHTSTSMPVGLQQPSHPALQLCNASLCLLRTARVKARE